MLDIKAHLKTLVEAHAPAGHEAPVRELIRAAWQPYVQSFQQDGLGSLIGIRPANRQPAARRKIMLAAHMDEIGLMVRDVVNGFIYVQRVGGTDHRVMLAQPVLVHGRRTLPGVVATTPPHLLKDRDRRHYPEFDALVIDVGLPAAEVAALVRVGDMITPDAPLLELAGKHLAGKAFDDRACVAIVTACLDMLQTMQHTWDVYATATVQEETGLLGATTAAYHIQPDVAIALDVGFAAQPGVSGDDAMEMGGGPALALGANIHPRLFDQLIAIAEKHEIKHQVEAIPAATGTDAWAIQVSRAGVPTALLSLPIRNMHSPVETLHLTDIERSARLLAHFITSLDDRTMDSLLLDKEPESATAAAPAPDEDAAED
ncbi:MAG: M42 family metallopeptidase [Anaerolineae bacterium]|nr:M42 family metallopeptidase [Anaerolineae bacterium]